MTAWKHILQTPVPPRAPGQRDVVGLTAPPLETVRIAVIGLGVRGQQAVRRLARIPGARVTVVCDTNPSVEVPGCSAVRLSDWREACAHPEVDLVYICTDWSHHVPVALTAMDSGKHVAVEVPAAQELDQIWALIDKAEQTRLHCMMLENAVYDRFERSCLGMAQAGILGDIVHTEGAYHHKIDFGKEVWRLDYNRGKPKWNSLSSI